MQHLPGKDGKRLFANDNLADARMRNGNHAEAEIIFRKLLAITGDDVPATAHNLANCLMFQCKYEEAIKLQRHSLRINRRVLGLVHRETLSTKQALATGLQANGQLEEAETMFRTTLTTTQRVLPKNDAATLAVMAGLANTLRALEKHAEAEEMLRGLDLVAIHHQLVWTRTSGFRRCYGAHTTLQQR